MREHTSLTVPKPTAQPDLSTRIPGPFTLEEKRKFFKGMVVSELEAGFLRYSRRKALIDYANKLGIGDFEATLLIAEAQYRSDEIDPVHFTSDFNLENVTRPDAWSIPLRLSFALLIAAFVDLCLIFWLFGV